EIRRDHAFLQRRDRDGHLERRPRRVAPLDRAIIEWPLLVVRQRGPRGAIHARCERVRIVRGHARVGEHLTTRRIEDDRGAVEAGALVPVLYRLLEVVVDRQLQPLPFDGLIFLERPDLAADAVYDDAARAVFAHEQRVVPLLDARLSDDVAAL